MEYIYPNFLKPNKKYSSYILKMDQKITFKELGK
jgi:hypothetical protein